MKNLKKKRPIRKWCGVIVAAVGIVVLCALVYPQTRVAAEDDLYDTIRQKPENEWTEYEKAYIQSSTGKRRMLAEALEKAPKRFPATSCPRAQMIVGGQISADQPRLSREMVLNIFSQARVVRDDKGFEEAVRFARKAMNEIAGAPDYVGGSGIGFEIYGFDDEMREFVCLRSLWGSAGFYEDGGDTPAGSVDIEP